MKFQLEIEIDGQNAEIIPMHLESGSWTVTREDHGWGIHDDKGDCVIRLCSDSDLAQAVGEAVESLLRTHGAGE